MKKKELICVICPNGCQLEAEIEEGPEIEVLDVQGHLCEKGLAYARQELVNPMRTIASSVVVDGGDFPLVSVRTDSPIPLESIFKVMKAIQSARVNAPVRIGDLLIQKPAGTSCSIIATRNVNPRSRDVS
jgi:CxxC motif-containing protein